MLFTVRAHGYCELEEARIPLFGVPEQHPDLASIHPVCGQVAVPGVTGHEHCVSSLPHPR